MARVSSRETERNARYRCGVRRQSRRTRREKSRPLIEVRVIKDVFSKQQKGQIIIKLTDAMVSIEVESMRGVAWCVVEET